jgi:hypothetical protein
MVKYRAIDEILEFIASSPKPTEVLAYKPPMPVQERVLTLVEKKKNDILSMEENMELDRFLLIEHIMRLAKKRAKTVLNS